MDRVRSNRPARRRTQPALSGDFDSSETHFAGSSQSPISPTMPFAQTPQTAPPRRAARQTSIPGTQSLSAASSPTTTGMSLRKRTRTFGFGLDGPPATPAASAAGAEDDDEPSHKKGSHNLRRRPKIDYAAQDFEDEVPEIAMPAPRTATRKRSDTFAEDMPPRRRAASKTPARRATNDFTMYLAQADDVVKDTIEVVGDSSDLHASDEVSEHESPAGKPQDRQGWDGPADGFLGRLLPSPTMSSRHASEKPEDEVMKDAEDQVIKDSEDQVMKDAADRVTKDAEEDQVTKDAEDQLIKEADEPETAQKTESEVAPKVEAAQQPAIEMTEVKEPEVNKVEATHESQVAQNDTAPETEIAHPQPIHINHVSIITKAPAEEPSSTQKTDITYTASSPSAKATEESITQQQSSQPEVPHLEISHPKEQTPQPSSPMEDALDTPGTPDGLEAAPTYAWSHLTPYLRGEFVLHPEPSAGAGAEEDDDAEDEAEDDDSPENGQDETNGDEGSRTATSTPQTPRRGTPAPGLTGANTPVLSDRIAALSKNAALRRRKQFRFRKLRDPADFQAYLQDHKDLPTEELWALLAHANDTLTAWQDEWHECGRHVDDYENAKRRAQQDAEYEKKTADLDQFARFESYLEKDFELRGYRAPIKEKEEGVHRTRWQDRVMAAAYGFEYDPHVSRVGNQDPVAQRDGIMAGRQLRSQPQQTAKAAEAVEGGDGLVITGKRTRNPPKLYEGLLQDDNRSATPAETNTAAIVKPPPKRRGRPPLVQQEEPQATQAAQPKKRGPRGRKSDALVDEDAGTPAPEVAAPLAKRRRGRQSKADEEEINDDDAPSDEGPSKRARTTRRRGKPDLSFLKRNDSHLGAETEEEESRPTTSSSNATVSDEGSTYGFRQTKRPRAQKEDEPEEAQPQRKRPRIHLINTSARAAQTQSQQILAGLAGARSLAPMHPTLMVTFKHLGADRWVVAHGEGSRESSTNALSMPASARPSAVPSIQPSAPPSTASSAAPSQAGGDDSAKDYSTMTKSEKMSASMKKRWMNGSMQNAVNKRKATLAAKKAAAAAAAAASTPIPTPPAPAQQVVSVPPQRLHPFINMHSQQQGRF